VRGTVGYEEEVDFDCGEVGIRKRKDWAGGTLEDGVHSFEHDSAERATTYVP